MKTDKWKDVSLHKYYGSYEWKQYKIETDDGVWTAYHNGEYLGYHKNEDGAKQICENHYKNQK